MAEKENNVVEITDDEGNAIKCEIYDIIEFEDKQYAIVAPAVVGEGEPEMVLMRYTEENGESYFETIEDDDEFDRVSEYADELMYMEEEEEEEEEEE